MGSGRPDVGGQLAESHGHMGQGNQAGQQQWQPRTDATPSVGPGSSRQHQAQGQTDLRPGGPGPSCVMGATPASLSLCLSAQGPAGGPPEHTSANIFRQWGRAVGR